MAQILPFCAVRYDSRRVPPSEVVTQPYDKISPEMQDRYYAESPYNLVRIILGRRVEDDSAEGNVYTRAVAYFREWCRQGILLQDSAPSLYGYSQRFADPGTGAQCERRGFIALGRLEDYSAGIVFRHEQTLAKPKADRLDLLRATRAQFEQLFMLYEDSGEIDSLFPRDSTPQPDPIIEVKDEYDVLHRVWQISDSGAIESVRARMRDKKLVIADGHHRYETALTYRNEQREAEADKKKANGSDSDFAVMTFIDMASPALVILPTHRVVRSLVNFSANRFRDAAAAYFAVKELEPDIDAKRATVILRDAGQAGTAFLAVTADRAFLLQKPDSGLKSIEGLSARQQGLDVVQLHKRLLEGVLNLSEESIREQKNISYIRDAGEALALVRNRTADVVFLMNPCRIDQMRDIAFAGEVMPQKSTDFYPKLLSGLTIYAMD